jgi:hypothetical protein
MKRVLRAILASVPLLFVGGYAGAGQDRSAPSDKWTWTERELKEIQAVEKRVKTKDGRFLLETANWKLNTPVSPRFTAELGTFMELFHAEFSKIARGKNVVDVTPTVMVFGSKAEYEKKFHDGTRGFFKYRWNGNGDWEEYHLYTYIESEKDRDFAVFYKPILLHEGTHALLRNLLGKTAVPTWLNEGLATYFQFWDLRSDAGTNAEKRWTRSIYRSHFKEHCLKDSDTLLDLAALLRVSEADWNPDRMGLAAKHNYAAAESFIDFLLSSEKNREQFTRIFAAGIKRDAEIKSLSPGWKEHVAKIAR